MTDRTKVRATATDCYLEDARGESFPLKSISTVGRDNSCDLVITEGFMSRQHARITIRGDEVWIEDLGSTNGTFVNGQRINELVRVEHNDEIRFDTVIYYLRKSIPATASDAATLVHGSTNEVEDSDATVSADDEQGAAGPAQSPIQSAVKTDEPIKGRGEGEVKKVPPSWLEDEASPNKTRLLSGTEIQEKLAQAARAKAARNGVPSNDSDFFRLVCASGDTMGKAFSLQAEDASESKWVVGRDQDIDITIDDTSISAQHFQIIHDKGRWKVVNLMASNGTFVNGERRLSCYLSDGDRIGAGDMEFIFQAPDYARSGVKSAVTTSTKKPSKWHLLLLIAIAVGIAVALVVLFAPE